MLFPHLLMVAHDSTKLVLFMTVNPFSAPGEGVGYHFSPNVRYRFNIDNTGDGSADMWIAVRFGTRTPTSQTLWATFPGGVVVQGEATMPTEEPVSNDPIINHGPNGMRVFAGPRDDPFFFDFVGFSRFLAGTGGFSGADTFAGFNVSAIVVEVPLAMVEGTSTTLQIWADTARQRITLRRAIYGFFFGIEHHIGPWEPIERMGNPAVATALILPEFKDAYNIGLPENDARDFAGQIVAILQSLGTDATNIGILASVALPDTLKLDPSLPSGYPNGRAPGDDVIDTLLFFIFNQTAVSDGANANDRDFPDTFPYLASPHQPD